jgi:serine/threonine protein kinase
MESEGHTWAVDYWALGVLLYEMVAGVSPFAEGEDTPHPVLFDRILRGKVTHPLSDYTDNPHCPALVGKLLVRDPLLRGGNTTGGIQDIINHPFFGSIDFDLYLQKRLPAPWIPQVSSVVDTSYFDAEGVEDHPSDGPLTAVDQGLEPSGKAPWDADF